MKKFPVIMATTLCSALFITSLAACATSDDTQKDPDVTYYTVSFESNGGSAVQSQEVAEGDYATRPEDPTKDGSVFGNWFADETLETPYEFETTAVTADTTLYASWVNASDALTATFYWNYDGAPDGGVFYTAHFESGKRIGSVESPVREGYAFGCWFDENGEEYSAMKKYDASVEFYAKWQASYTFEAEDTQITGLTDDYALGLAQENGDKTGYNFSGSANGKNLVKEDSRASNGHYISGLFYRGAYLEFIITADKADDNASLTLVLGCEYGDISLTAAKYQVSINGVPMAYTAKIELGDGSEGGETTPGLRGGLKEIKLGGISLKEGENKIRLTVNNSDLPVGEAGTVDAASPAVDCIKINSDAVLEMTIFEGNY